MKIQEIMSREVCTCAQSATLNEAAQIMWEHDCGFVPVVDDATEAVVGVITDRDISMAAYTSGLALKEMLVGQSMSSAPKTCSAEDSLESVETEMRVSRVRRLPVVDASKHPIGVISIADLARVAELERMKKQPRVTNEEVGETLGAISQPRRLAAHSN